MHTVRQWLEQLGLAQYAKVFADNDVDLESLRLLAESDLEKLGVSLGHRKKLLKAVSELDGGMALTPPASLIQASPPNLERESIGAEGERRQLTVLFCDMVGFTDLASRVDPEILQKIIGSYEDTCAVCITRYEGYVFQRLGDGIVAFFGYPLAHEGEVERAIRAGLEIIDALAKREVPDAGRLAVRIGIATGVVVVSSAGKGAVGETMNLASRLQAIAQTGSIVVSERVHRLAGGSFHYENLGEQSLKGIAQPTHAYRILGVTEAASRFEAATQEGLTPLVGREQEIGLLLERWALAQDGEGQVVLLSGEPGIGKSRILSALRERLEGQGAQALRFQCSPYYVNSVFWPSIGNFERALKFTRDETVECKLDKLEALVVDHYGRPLSDVRFVASILSIPSEQRYGAHTMTPQKQKDETLRTLVDLTEAAARKQPCVMLYEDLHWADPTTLEVLDLLIDRVRTIPLLIVLTHRPEFQSRWSEQGHVSALNLSKLTRAQSAAIVSRLSGGKALPAALIEQIVAKTDGVPLFVEELTKTVLESGLLKDRGDRYELDGPLPPLAIPSTLHDSLMARLDRLATVKEVAQIGACIGREFSHELLAVVSPMSERLLGEALKQLVRSQLVFQHGAPPQATYTFKHALVQDAAYGSLLKSRRQVLHKSIAETLEQGFSERLSNEPEVIAHHYTEAGLNKQATDYWLKAGQRGVGRFANAEAIAHLNRGMATLIGSPEGEERDRRELLLQINLGTALGNSKGYTPPEVGQAFSRARKLCEQVGDMPQMLSILFGLSKYYVMRAEYHSSGEMDKQILVLARQSQDMGALIAGHQSSCVTELFKGDFHRAIEHADLGWKAYNNEEHRDLALTYGYNPGPLCHDLAAWALLIIGYPEQAIRRHKLAVDLATQLRHPLTVATVVVHASFVACLRGDIQAALSHARDAIAICKENGILIRQTEGEMLEGWALAELRDTEHGIPQLEAGIQVWHQLGAQIANPWWYSCLARAYIKAGRITDASEALTLALDATNKNGERLTEAELYRIEGDLWLALDGSEARAEASYRKAIEVATELKAKLWELRAATALARLWRDQGKKHEARALLQPTYDWFTEGFDTKDLTEAKALLDQLS